MGSDITRSQAMRWDKGNVAELRKPRAVSPLAVPGGGRTLRGRPNMHRVTSGILGLSREFFAPQIRTGSKVLDLKDTLFQGNKRFTETSPGHNNQPFENSASF